MQYKDNSQDFLLKLKHKNWLIENTYALTDVVLEEMRANDIAINHEGKYFDTQKNLEVPPGKFRYMLEKVFLKDKLPANLCCKTRRGVLDKIVESLASSAEYVSNNPHIVIDDQILMTQELEGVHK